MDIISTETVAELASRLEDYNRAYRAGQPLVDDAEYDRLVEALRGRDPAHPFLHAVEPEQFETRKEVRHPAPMLSIEKAYDHKKLALFFQRVEKEAADIGVLDLHYRVVPKLDGIAGRDDGEVFASRGNGEVGYEISSAFEKGVIPIGGRGLGIGEIVAVKSYFDEHLSHVFEHPRNMVVGIVSSDILNADAKQALEDGAVRFVPYGELPSRISTAEEILESITDFSAELAAKTDYPLDGTVIMVTDEAVRKHMGATAHHYRWQIAYKEKGDTAVTTVEEIQWQVGRTGNVTPVMAVAPVNLSGATIRRVTAHHAGKVRNEAIGVGAEIEIIRSGEVIPKLEKVLTPSMAVTLPEQCPVCSQPLEWENDFLKCPNDRCQAKIEQGLIHWFRILGTADWFGVKTVQKLVGGGYDSLEKIYAMIEADFVALGFGPVQSKNLFNAILISRTKAVEDWRFLAAFGIADLGVGDSRKLLTHVRLENLENLRSEEIQRIHGFGEKTGRSIAVGIQKIRPTLRHMLALEFNLVRSRQQDDASVADSPVADKGIVFTGKMVGGSREEMQEAARQLGARVQTSVTGKTDYLVCGAKVGGSKIAKAEKMGVAVLSEEDYRVLISNL